MSLSIAISDLSDPDLYQEVVEFFHRHTNRSFHQSNILFQARVDGALIGLVRLCYEENRHILRSMEIKKEHQRKGIGTKLLAEFQTYVDQRDIGPIYCLPYAHLESFYAQIGFKRIKDEDLPPFLKLRVEAYRRKRPDEKFCGMMRLGRGSNVS